MPASYTILPEWGLVCVHYDGFVTLDDTKRIIGQYTAPPSRRPDPLHLVDLSEVTGLQINSSH